MPPSYQVLFLFNSPQGLLAEVKQLDQAADAPKDRVYHWLWIAEASVTTLRFLRMSTSPRQERSFEEAQLWFDDVRAELRWASGRTVELVAEDCKELPRTQHWLVQQHLS